MPTNTNIINCDVHAEWLILLVCIVCMCEQQYYNVVMYNEYRN